MERQLSNREGEDLPEGALPPDLDLKTADIVYYGFPLSPPCTKIRALLNFYGIPYKVVDAQPNQKKEGLPDDSYGKVPKIVVNGIQINDSAVIYRTLVPYLTGKKLTKEEAELEANNNVRGLMGALELESFSQYSGIVGAVRSGLKLMGPSEETRLGYAFSYVAPIVPYGLGLIWPLPWLVKLAGIAPHGKDGPALEHGKKWRDALGSQKYFHGETLGPLDLSLYGTMKTFLQMHSPVADAVLEECGLAYWYARVDAAFDPAFGGRPLY